MYQKYVERKFSEYIDQQELYRLDRRERNWRFDTHVEATEILPPCLFGGEKLSQIRKTYGYQRNEKSKEMSREEQTDTPDRSMTQQNLILPSVYQHFLDNLFSPSQPRLKDSPNDVLRIHISTNSLPSKQVSPSRCEKSVYALRKIRHPGLDICSDFNERLNILKQNQTSIQNKRHSNQVYQGLPLLEEKTLKLNGCASQDCLNKVWKKDFLNQRTPLNERPRKNSEVGYSSQIHRVISGNRSSPTLRTRIFSREKPEKLNIFQQNKQKDISIKNIERNLSISGDKSNQRLYPMVYQSLSTKKKEEPPHPNFSPYIPKQLNMFSGSIPDKRYQDSANLIMGMKTVHMKPKIHNSTAESNKPKSCSVTPRFRSPVHPNNIATKPVLNCKPLKAITSTPRIPQCNFMSPKQLLNEEKKVLPLKTEKYLLKIQYPQLNASRNHGNCKDGKFISELSNKKDRNTIDDSVKNTQKRNLNHPAFVNKHLYKDRDLSIQGKEPKTPSPHLAKPKPHPLIMCTTPAPKTEKLNFVSPVDLKNSKLPNKKIEPVPKVNKKNNAVDFQYSHSNRQANPEKSASSPKSDFIRARIGVKPTNQPEQSHDNKERISEVSSSNKQPAKGIYQLETALHGDSKKETEDILIRKTEYKKDKKIGTSQYELPNSKRNIDKIVGKIVTNPSRSEKIVVHSPSHSKKTVEANQIDNKNKFNAILIDKKPKVDPTLIRNEKEIITKPIEKKQEIDPTLIYNEQAIITKPIEKKREIDPKPIRNEQAINTKRIEEKREIDLKPIRNEKAINTKRIEEKREIDLKPIRNEKAINTKHIEEKREIDPKPIRNEKEINTKRIEEKREIDLKPIRNEKAINTKHIEEKREIDPTLIYNEQAINTKRIEEKREIDLKPIRNEKAINTKPSETKQKVVENPTIDNENNVEAMPTELEQKMYSNVIDTEKNISATSTENIKKVIPSPIHDEQQIDPQPIETEQNITKTLAIDNEKNTRTIHQNSEPKIETIPRDNEENIVVFPISSKQTNEIIPVASEPQVDLHPTENEHQSPPSYIDSEPNIVANSSRIEQIIDQRNTNTEKKVEDAPASVEQIVVAYSVFSEKNIEIIPSANIQKIYPNLTDTDPQVETIPIPEEHKTDPNPTDTDPQVETSPIIEEQKIGPHSADTDPQVETIPIIEEQKVNSYPTSEDNSLINTHENNPIESDVEITTPIAVEISHLQTEPNVELNNSPEICAFASNKNSPKSATGDIQEAQTEPVIQEKLEVNQLDSEKKEDTVDWVTKTHDNENQPSEEKKEVKNEKIEATIVPHIQEETLQSVSTEKGNIENIHNINENVQKEEPKNIVPVLAVTHPDPALFSEPGLEPQSAVATSDNSIPQNKEENPDIQTTSNIAPVSTQEVKHTQNLTGENSDVIPLKEENKVSNSQDETSLVLHNSASITKEPISEEENLHITNPQSLSKSKDIQFSSEECSIVPPQSEGVTAFKLILHKIDEEEQDQVDPLQEEKLTFNKGLEGKVRINDPLLSKPLASQVYPSLETSLNNFQEFSAIDKTQNISPKLLESYSKESLIAFYKREHQILSTQLSSSRPTVSTLKMLERKKFLSKHIGDLSEQLQLFILGSQLS